MEFRVPPFIHRALAWVEAFLDRHGTLCVAAFAFLYYGLYIAADLPLTGEAGSNVLIAQRILEGWRPIKDMFIGYNLMWFYPLSWIFEFTGPHLLASRVYFTILSGISGILGFLLVRKVTGRSTLAGIAAGLMILMPGAMYRNNVGFVAVLASFALVYGYVIPHCSRLVSVLWMAFSGAAMSLCFLIRIEPSLIATMVWIGLLFLYPIGVRGAFLSRLKVLIAGSTLAILAFSAVHAPFLIHTQRSGFGPEFRNQYTQFVRLLTSELQREMQKFTPKPSAKDKVPVENPLVKAQVETPQVDQQPEKLTPPKNEGADGRRPRAPLSDAFKSGGLVFFPLSMYFPILSAGLLSIAGCLFFLSGSFSNQKNYRMHGLAILATTGCALALFPQYFFFRPDSVHLAEFMVPFYPALACASAAALTLLKGGRSRWLFATLILVVTGLQVIVAFNSLFGREGSGSIRLARGKSALFEAPGGIYFLVKPEDHSDWVGLRDLLANSTKENDYLVTYPYVPLLNVLAQRPSYQFKLYVDNATESPDFSEKTIAEIEEQQPAVVVVNNRAINKTEFSRFRNWAAPVYNYLEQNYVQRGIFFNNVEVFVRPDRVPPPSS